MIRPVPVDVRYASPTLDDLRSVELVVAEQDVDVFSLERGIRNRLRVDGQMVVVALEHGRRPRRDRAVVRDRSRTPQPEFPRLGWRTGGGGSNGGPEVRKCAQPSLQRETGQQTRLLPPNPEVMIVRYPGGDARWPEPNVRPGRGAPGGDGALPHLATHPEVDGFHGLEPGGRADERDPIVGARRFGPHREPAPAGRGRVGDVHLADLEKEEVGRTPRVRTWRSPRFRPCRLHARRSPYPRATAACPGSPRPS